MARSPDSCQGSNRCLRTALVTTMSSEEAAYLARSLLFPPRILTRVIAELAFTSHLSVVSRR
jgi:energy-coupling factor transporter transmembrane protein EcfT